MQIPCHPWNKLKSSNFCAKLLCSENMLVTHPKIPAHVFIFPVISYCASLSYFEGRFTPLPVVRDWDVGSVWFCLLICFMYLLLFLWASGWEVLLLCRSEGHFLQTSVCVSWEGQSTLPRASVAHRQRPGTSKQYPDRGEEWVVDEKGVKKSTLSSSCKIWCLLFLVCQSSKHTLKGELCTAPQLEK